MALDQVLLEGRAAGECPNTLRFLQFSGRVVLVGFNQQLDQEVRLDFCRPNGIEINRRITGGGALLWEPSHIGWEIVAGRDHPLFRRLSPAEIGEKVCRMFSEALRKATGVQASFRPRNDIEVNGRKISGTGGTTEGDAFLYQGTLLVDLDVMTMLRALRAPMEKLKAHEIDSLLERVTTLRAELGFVPPAEEIKRTIAAAFAEDLGIEWTPAGLNPWEERRFTDLLPEFESEAWIDRRTGASRRKMLKAVHNGPGGLIRLLVDVDERRRRIRSVVIAGDFFSFPARAIYDLESRFKDLPATIEQVEAELDRFFGGAPSPFPGLGPDDFGTAFRKALEKISYLELGFTHEETNDLFPVCGGLAEVLKSEIKWLLLPYCAKDLQCDYRNGEGCTECGICTIGDGYTMARSHALNAVTITSFENLEANLLNIRAGGGAGFIGCCCEAFYTKHSADFERAGVPGVLISMDSTTCYDLGKSRAAYHGNFENQTDINIPLVNKVIALSEAAR